MKRTELKARQREKYLKMIIELLDSKDEEILRVDSGTIAFPIVDEEGNEDFITVKVSIPSGSRDGEAYDGYSLAEEYAMKQKLNAEKAAEMQRKKEAKIVRDEKIRQSKDKIMAKAKAKGKTE